MRPSPHVMCLLLTLFPLLSLVTPCPPHNATYTALVLALIPTLPDLPLTDALPVLTALAITDDGGRDHVLLENHAAALGMLGRRLNGQGQDDSVVLAAVVHEYHRAASARTANEDCEMGQRKVQGERAGVLRAWGDALQWQGRAEEARKVFEMGVKEGIWASHVCRPETATKGGLEGAPYFIDGGEAIELLERNMGGIIEAFQRGAGGSDYRLESGGLQSSESWHHLTLMVDGQERACEGYEEVCEAARGLKLAKRGQVKFSRMQRGTVVRPHAGPTEERVRIHCGVSGVGEGSWMRVGEEVRGWEVGKCWAFKEWCEHEVQVAGGEGEDRVVLIVDVENELLGGLRA